MSASRQWTKPLSRYGAAGCTGIRIAGWGVLSEMGVLNLHLESRSIPMTDEAISPLRRRMIEDMTIRKFAPKTQH